MTTAYHSLHKWTASPRRRYATMKFVRSSLDLISIIFRIVKVSTFKERTSNYRVAPQQKPFSRRPADHRRVSTTCHRKTTISRTRKLPILSNKSRVPQ